MRLFVAAAVPDEVRTRLADAVDDGRREHPDWRWTRPEGWHVTVAFLGEVADDEVARIEPALREGTAGRPAMVLRLGSLGRFGSRVLHVAVEDDPPGALASLGAGVQAALAAADLPVQQREVRGHLTLARSTRKRRIDRLPDLPVPRLAWDVGEVGLYESRTQRGGARYRCLTSVELG